jgi:hypothetical protein
MNDNSARGLDYKAHILIGYASSGKMTVICRWPHLPRQTEVQRAIDTLQEGYATFLLCIPTAIMPAQGNGERKQNSSPRLG